MAQPSDKGKLSRSRTRVKASLLLYLNILHRGVVPELPHALRVGEEHVTDPLGVQVPEAHVVARRLDDHVVEAEPADGPLPGLVPAPVRGTLPLRHGRRRLHVAAQRRVEVLDDADPPRLGAVGRHAEDLGRALGLAAGAEGAGRLGRIGPRAGARVGGAVGLEVGGAARARRREDDPPPEHGVTAGLRGSRGSRRRHLECLTRREGGEHCGFVGLFEMKLNHRCRLAVI